MIYKIKESVLQYNRVIIIKMYILKYSREEFLRRFFNIVDVELYSIYIRSRLMREQLLLNVGRF